MITKELFEHFSDIGYSYEGSLEGGGIAISETIAIPYQESDCNEVFLAVEHTSICSEYLDSLEAPSTDVKKNDDGSYTIVGAKNDNDNNIYIVDEQGNRTSEVIGETLRPYDFMNTNDSDGTFTDHADITFDTKKLNVSGTIMRNKHVTESIYNANGEELVIWGMKIFQNELQAQSPSTFYGQLEVLRFLSANYDALNSSSGQGSLDLKSSLGLPKYTPIQVGTTRTGKPIITTLRAMGNLIFGANMRKTKPLILTKKWYYDQVMKQVGSYNQSQNKGEGYNIGFPYFGEIGRAHV